MNVLYSPTVGILVSRAAGATIPDVHFLVEEEQWSDVEKVYLLSNIRDWQVVESDADDLAPVFQSCTEDYWVSRSQSLIICLIQGVSDSLAIEVLEHIDSILQLHCSADKVLNRLLIAPLKAPGRAEVLAKLALAEGYATTGGILDRLVDLQPLLRRFVETWLNLPAEGFVDLPVSRETLWQDLATRRLLTRLLEATNKDAFTGIWATLALADTGVSGRGAIFDLGKQLADAIYPTSVRRAPRIVQVGDNDRIDDDLAGDFRDAYVPGHVAYTRVLKQVREIAQLLAKGKDARASRFLRELIAEQLRSSSSEHLSKSLCNIAQRCADMFRPDYERQCLDEAMAVAPNDAWTVIQMGNHLKRVGQHQEAIEMLQRAAKSAQANIAVSSIADVWCEMGSYDKATEVYEGIPGWQQLLEVRTGLADIMRYRGEFDQALSEYDRILTEWPDEDRARAGKAEIFKRQGAFDEAITLYDLLIYNPAAEDVDKSVYRVDKSVYRMAKCAILKQANRLDEAFNLADEIVRETPFHMLARVHRASVLALLGKEKQGLDDLPPPHAPRAFENWIEQYCRGLLLLKLKRYEKAKKLLVERLGSAVLASDNQVVVRLGAAFAFLCHNDVEPAVAELSQIRDVHDYYTAYVHQVLELHVSVVRNDKKRIEEIIGQLASVQERDPAVAKAIAALRRNDFATATKYELELLFRIAA
jgi:tetratricopeptide (TPR) repeat protein